MYRDFFTNKWTIGCFSLLIVFSVGCIIWYRYETGKHMKVLSDEAEYTQHLQNEHKKNTNKKTKNKNNTTSRSSNSMELEQILKTPEVVPEADKEKAMRNDSIDNDPALSNHRTIESHFRVSPHGFGPYPEVSEEFQKTVGIPSWIRTEEFGTPPVPAEIELIERIKIKLWNNGHTTVRGGFYTENGRVIMNYTDVAYVRFGTRLTPDGNKVKFLSTWTSTGTPMPQRDTLDPYDTSDLVFPPNMKIIDLGKEDPSIDPYEFLDLKK